MLKPLVSVLTAAALLGLGACADLQPGGNTAGGQPRPAFKDTTLGMATVSSLIIALELKRQQTQETLKEQKTPQAIAKYQSRLTALDALKGNMVSYSAGNLSLGDRISLVNASADLAKAKLPEYTDIIGMLSTVSQVLVTAQGQARTAP